MTALSNLFAKPTPPERPGVQLTKELLRILGLPRRVLDLDKNTLNGRPIYDATSIHTHNQGTCAEHPRCPVCASGQARIWPAQSAALREAETQDGLFGPLSCGSGKTLVTLLIPMLVPCTRPVLLIPASLRDQLLDRDLAAYGRHFLLPKNLTVISYSELSVVSGADSLERIQPDLIIADECHNLSGDSARSARFIRYMRAHPKTRLCAVSGTVTKRSIRDFAGLCQLALGKNSPLPRSKSDLDEWADALDPIPDAIPVGALRVFADINHPEGSDDQKAAVRDGFRRRLVETPGVVATSASWEGASLTIRALRPKLPPAVKKALDDLRTSWRIEDEDIEDSMRLVQVARQLASGFYYRWKWPGGVRDEQWLTARASWHRAVRGVLEWGGAGLDSPLLVARAAAAGKLDSDVANAWEIWAQVRDRYQPAPPTEAVWVSRFVMEAAKDWARMERGIVWYGSDAVGVELHKHMPVYGAGTDAGAATEGTIACSIRAQGTGKNLQKYARALVLEPPASGAAWEQLLSRQHRPGQAADEVSFDVMMHTAETEGAIWGAVNDAVYVQGTQGQRQKLLSARRIEW